MARYENLQVSIPRGHLLSYDYGTKLSKGHLKEISDAEYGFLQFIRPHLILSNDDRVFKGWRLWLLEWIIGQSLDNAHHLGDWVDNDPVRVI